MNDDLEVGQIAPRPARPVAKADPPPFTLGEDWHAHAVGIDPETPLSDDVVVLDDPAVLTKSEAIQLAKLIVLYPFLSKVL
jgi:hypothetical protein